MVLVREDLCGSDNDDFGSNVKGQRGRTSLLGLVASCGCYVWTHMANGRQGFMSGDELLAVAMRGWWRCGEEWRVLIVEYL